MVEDEYQLPPFIFLGCQGEQRGPCSQCNPPPPACLFAAIFPQDTFEALPPMFPRRVEPGPLFPGCPKDAPSKGRRPIGRGVGGEWFFQGWELAAGGAAQEGAADGSAGTGPVAMAVLGIGALAGCGFPCLLPASPVAHTAQRREKSCPGCPQGGPCRWSPGGDYLVVCSQAIRGRLASRTREKFPGCLRGFPNETKVLSSLPRWKPK